MATERRNDMGWKFTVGIMVFIVTSVLTIFFNHTYGMSKEAKSAANMNTIVNARQDEQIKYYDKSTEELKLGQNEIKKLLMSR